MAAIVDAVASVPGRRPSESHPVAAGVGFVLVDQSLRPLYIDDQSLRILTYPGGESQSGVSPVDLQERVRRVLNAERYTAEVSSTVSFLSGRRRYLCRSALLRSCLESVGAPTVVLVLERQYRVWSTVLSDATHRFNLSQRETETVQHLVHGLTTKEIASRMNVSPNTVKQFLRLIMSKMSVSTRAGVLGKIGPS